MSSIRSEANQSPIQLLIIPKRMQTTSFFIVRPVSLFLQDDETHDYLFECNVSFVQMTRVSRVRLAREKIPWRIVVKFDI